MTSCADCRRSVSRRSARVYVGPEGELAKVLCQSCQTTYAKERQYLPTELPAKPRYDISERGV